ncbi:EamA family transporter [Flavobacterium sp. F-380]|uniref:EamA family transporter n=1 Tax=Flavobacterium kayseriense TaxID=2764714 RepID=A0ABR7J4Z5_9FLAO|nr:EamA family transporter [Flavobacterium kayseriense]MBC5840614.1 EamA family transporter [Flavobacterium kayseriense]MBC5846716.1 EamA family transporter [Flavobacterium kayseriense]
MKSKIVGALSAPKNANGLAIVALCFVCFFWGTTWIASKEGVKHMPALQLAGIRQLIGGLLYVAYFLMKKEPLPKGKQWKTIIILSILNFALSNGLSTWGVKYISSGLGAIINAIFPIWIVIITFFRGEKLAKLAIAGLVIAFSGVCVIFYEHLNDLLIPDFRFGIILLTLSTISWAFGSLYTKKKAATFNPYFSLGIQMLFSSILLLTITETTGMAVPINTVPAASWWSIAYLVIIGSIISFIAYIYMLQKLPPEINSIYAYVNPIIAVLLGAIIFGESLTVAIGIGGLITLSGLYMVNHSIKKNKRILAGNKV